MTAKSCVYYNRDAWKYAKAPDMRPLIGVTLLLAASFGSAQYCRKTDIDQSSGFALCPLPN
jgi:hypothetical protein